MYSNDILSRFVKQDSCVLAISHEHAERTDIMVAHGVFLHLIKQQRGVVIAITTFLLRLTAIDHNKCAIVVRSKKARYITNVIAVEGTAHARHRHCNNAVTNIRQIQINILVLVGETAPSSTHGGLQFAPKLFFETHDECTVGKRKADHMQRKCTLVKCVAIAEGRITVFGAVAEERFGKQTAYASKNHQDKPQQIKRVGP
mmetsp:Transcript_64411/g.104198  ORF Transcript_64411/g.104198 Transcript_64411/m.104198 type:complete len:201 (+) Transcript_64411:2824-3426(+)